MIEFTEAAKRQILAFMEQDGVPGLAVRVRVASPSPTDGIPVVVDPESARILEGTRVDWVDTLQESGFKFHNPNIQPLGSEPLTGPLAERVQRVLTERINPSVAMHGGAVSLVDIRDNIVYLQMSGGCQGCGMASVTLTQGVKQVLHDMVPEIVDVQDVTDHASGTDPYFSPAK
jgi:Fe/S biogenesis protein NfuA